MTRLYSAAELEPIVGVPAHTIQRWRREGKIMPAGMMPSRGRTNEVALYTLEEVESEAALYRARRHDDTRPGFVAAIR